MNCKTLLLVSVLLSQIYTANPTCSQPKTVTVQKEPNSYEMSLPHELGTVEISCLMIHITEIKEECTSDKPKLSLQFKTNGVGTPLNLMLDSPLLKVRLPYMSEAQLQLSLDSNGEDSCNVKAMLSYTVESIPEKIPTPPAITEVDKKLPHAGDTITVTLSSVSTDESIKVSSSVACTEPRSTQPQGIKIMFEVQGGDNWICIGGNAIGSIFATPTEATYAAEISCSGDINYFTSGSCQITVKGASGVEEKVGVIHRQKAETCSGTKIAEGTLQNKKQNAIATLSLSNILLNRQYVICIKSGDTWHEAINLASLPSQYAKTLTKFVDRSAIGGPDKSEDRVVPGLSNLYFGLIIGGSILLIIIVAITIWAFFCRGPVQDPSGFKVMK